MKRFQIVSFMILFLVFALAPMAQAITLTPNPSTKTSGTVSAGAYKYYKFAKLANSKCTVVLKTISGNANLYGHWTSAVSRTVAQYKSEKTGLSYDYISFDATSSGTYYLAVYGAVASSYTIYVVRNSMGIPSQLDGQLTCPLAYCLSTPCGTLTSSKYGPFGSVWGNKSSDPFFSGAEDKFHIGVDWVANEYAPVYAVADGVVLRPDPSKDDIGSYGTEWGYFVVIQHEVNGYIFTAVYGHLNEDDRLQKGDVVNAGDQVGSIFHLAVADEVDHLHLNMNTGGYKSATAIAPFNNFPQTYFNAGNLNLY